MRVPFIIRKLRNQRVQVVLAGIIGGYLIIAFILMFCYIHSLKDTKNVSQGYNDSLQISTDNTFASLLYKNVRVLCWIMTEPLNHKEKSVHIKKTWGKRCNYLVFISSKSDPVLPTVELPAKAHLWENTRDAFRYIYFYYADKADWFLKADDDSYVIVENLRYMLLQHDSEKPVYFGCNLKSYMKKVNKGSGYVLSRQALTQFVKHDLPSSKICSNFGYDSEDVEIEKCLQAVNIRAGDSRDSLGKNRFFPLPPQFHFKIESKPFWLWDFLFYKSQMEKSDCCSENAISFRHIDPTYMYILDYLIYELKAFGININLVIPKNI